MSMIGFPLLLIPLALYNILAFLMPGLSLGAPLAAVPLLSSARYQLTFSDMLLTLAMLMVTFEIVKTSRPGAKYLTDHLLSFAVLCGAAAEFALLPPFATSTFFLLTVLAAVEFAASITIAWRREVPTAVSHASDGGAEPEPEPSHALGSAAGHELIWEKLPSQAGEVPGQPDTKIAAAHPDATASHPATDQPSRATDDVTLGSVKS